MIVPFKTLETRKKMLSFSVRETTIRHFKFVERSRKSFSSFFAGKKGFNGSTVNQEFRSINGVS